MPQVRTWAVSLKGKGLLVSLKGVYGLFRRCEGYLALQEEMRAISALWKVRNASRKKLAFTGEGSA
jgi:hypothetical protein